MKTRLAAVLSVALLATTLAGCSNDPSKPSGDATGTFRVVTVNVDGRDIRCVTWKDGHGGGISCNWQGTS